MVNWRARVQEVLHSEDNRDSRDARSENRASVAIVPSVLPLDPVATLADWHGHLSALDVYDVPDGLSQNRWGTLVLDSWWLYETHASRLVRDGWSAIDLFGVITSQPGWGGLAHRLQGSRSMLIDDAGKVYWRRAGVSFELSRGVGEALRESNARLLWLLDEREEQN